VKHDGAGVDESSAFVGVGDEVLENFAHNFPPRASQ